MLFFMLLCLLPSSSQARGKLERKMVGGEMSLVANAKLEKYKQSFHNACQMLLR